MPDTTSPDFNPESLSTLEYETPFFLFSKKRILNKLKEFEKHFPGSTVHYAVKANSEQPILELLNEAGASFEAASRFELEFLKKAEVPGERIIYGTSIKPAVHIKEFSEYGVDRFAADSFPELEKIALHAPGSRVYIRMSVNDTGSVFRFSEKFGTPKANVAPLLRHAQEIGLQPYGISFHVGSQASNPLAWAHALREVKEVMEELKKYDIEIEVLNLGGGFPCHYLTTEETSDIPEIAKLTLEEFNNRPEALV